MKVMGCRRQQAERFTKAFGCGGEVSYAGQSRAICQWPRDERGTGRRESTLRPGLYSPEAWERTATAGEAAVSEGLVAGRGSLRDPAAPAAYLNRCFGS